MNGWKRIGIIASVTWVIGAGGYTLKKMDDKTSDSAAFFYKECTTIRDARYQTQTEYCWQRSETSPMIDAFNACMEKFQTENPDTCSERNIDYVIKSMPGERMTTACVALIPIPFAWGAVYLLLFLVQWVKKGFVR